MSSGKHWKLDYYEDDVVTYNNRGTRPAIPKKYETHRFYWKHIKHELKSFPTKENADIAARIMNKKTYGGNFVSFYCTQCYMWHITTDNNYRKYVL